LVIPQEEASAVASLVLDPKPGETVVDLAAAPGGKTAHMAELMNNEGKKSLERELPIGSSSTHHAQAMGR